MRKLLLLGVVSLGLHSCSDSHESLSKDMLNQLEKLVVVLESVDSNTKPADFEAKMKPIIEKMGELRNREKAVGKPTPEDKARLTDQFEKDFNAMRTRIEAATIKARSVEGADKLIEAAMKNM
jgi:hypothetical protein